MAYRFKLKEPFGRGLRRIARDELRMVEAALAEAVNDPATAGEQIHGARRGLKRLRSLLRLARGEVREKAWRRLDRRLSEIGRMLAGRRDLAVMLETLEELEAEGGISPTTKGTVRELVVERRTDLAFDDSDGDVTELAREALFAVARRIRRLDVGQGPPAEAPGLERCYRVARASYRHAYGEAPDAEAFHDLRKVVQRHWRHLQLMSRAWPEVLDSRIATARECSRLLGLEQDLAVLATFVETEASARGRRATRALRLEVLGACRAKQVALREAAEPLLARLLAEPPKSHARTIGRLWASARRMHLAVAMDRQPEPGRAIDAA